MKASRGHGYILLTAVLSLLLAGCGIRAAQDISIRPVEITVLDAGTDLPLEGVRLYQVIETEVYGSFCIILIPRLEPTDHRYHVTEAITDMNGTATFKKKDIHLGCTEYIHVEKLLVNVDVKYEEGRRYGVTREERFSSIAMYDEDWIYNPNKAYKGAVIYSSDFEFPAGYGFITPLYRNILDDKGLLKEKSEFRIPLERKHTFERDYDKNIFRIQKAKNYADIVYEWLRNKKGAGYVKWSTNCNNM